MLAQTTMALALKLWSVSNRKTIELFVSIIATPCLFLFLFSVTPFPSPTGTLEAKEVFFLLGRMGDIVTVCVV